MVQLFGSKPEHFAEAVRMLEKELKPDGFDINFGCPVKKVVCKGAGAGVLKDVDLMIRLTKAVIKGTS